MCGVCVCVVVFGESDGCLRAAPAARIPSVGALLCHTQTTDMLDKWRHREEMRGSARRKEEETCVCGVRVTLL